MAEIVTGNLPALLLVTGLAVSAPAQAGEVSGRLELGFQSATAPGDSVTALFGGPDHDDLFSDLRLRWSHDWGDVSTEFHYRISATSGPGAGIAAALGTLAPPPPPGNFFDLSRTIDSSPDSLVEHRIDRLSFTWSQPEFVLRVGRQALTWGAGTVFHPMDLVAPFSPDTFDTEFKPGVDMIYSQFLMNDGSDLELIAVPRRAVAGGPATADASTFAMRYRTTLGDLGAEVILARDHADTTAGLGLSGSLGGAAWNLEIVPTRLAGGGTRTSALANMSTGMTILDRSALVFAEYYHNGFGVAGTPSALDALPPELADRLSRGQVFTVAQDYLALGLSLSWSPRLNITGGVVFNLADQSRLASFEAGWSLSDNADIMLGAQIPGGRRGSEFGGLPLSGAGAPYAMPDRTVYLRFRQYF